MDYNYEISSPILGSRKILCQLGFETFEFKHARPRKTIH